MGEPVTGMWERTYTVPYSGAAKWGTGINPIHSFYGSSPLRVYGRNNTMPEVHPPGTATEDIIETESPWGYQPEDIAGLDVYQLSTEDSNWAGVPFDPDGYPSYDLTTPQTRATTDPREIYAVGSPQAAANRVRAIRWGPQDGDDWVSKQVPTATVSEGWLNKPASGMKQGESADNNVTVSDPEQYEVQTSMVQRTKEQDNGRAVLRGTDEAREPIASRIAPMKLKVYSTGERLYDMDPYQIEDIPRPFYYRTAGTGRDNDMLPNEMIVISPLQRTPPPDPSLGPQEITLNQGGGETYGYTYEDAGWY